MFSNLSAGQEVKPPAADLIDSRRLIRDFDALDSLPILVETSPPIANLLMRADEGIMRRDWKLAIDSLQRVIDDRAGTLVPSEDVVEGEGVLFESARRHALRRLASMPAEGLFAYRVLYDGKAKGLYERAKAASDLAAMESLADRFLLTRYGDDAAEWVASRAFDEGRFAEAVIRLRDILSFVPDHDVTAQRIYAKLYAAYTIMGLQPEAQKTLIAWQEKVDSRAAGLSASLDVRWTEQTRQLLEVRETREGVLPQLRGSPLSPSIAGPVPWKHELSGTASDLWRKITDHHPGDPPPIPRIKLAGNGQQVFGRIPGGIVALDMEDLSPVWQTVSVSLPRNVQVEDARRGLNPAAGIKPSGPYVDDPLNEISQALGLVFAIERQGSGEFQDRDEVQAGGILFVRPGSRFLRQASGTRLIAYDAQTGDIRWQRGRSESAEDVLGSVRFLSTPIAVEDQLWVAYAQGSDLYVAALRPSDGTLLKQALIGSMREPPQAREPAPPKEPLVALTYKDGAVYVPTGIGAVAALDVPGMQVKWIFVYDTLSGGRRRAEPSSRWIAGAPIVESATVVIAAPDSDAVLALDAATGEPRWSAKADSCTYAVAAGAGKLWLGGQRIACLSLVDGVQVWSRDLADTPTGRAALCGDQIHIPLSSGFMTLSASTGDPESVQELPASQAPLGNLACVGSSLYSIDPTSIRKFPDVQRMLQTAQEELQRQPHSAAAAVRLAWARIFQGDAQRSLEAVHSFSNEASLPLRLRMSIARVKIESILAIARDSKTPQEALRLLQEASAADLTPSLRLRLQSAVADQLAALGRLEEAYHTLLSLALSPDAAELDQAEEGVRVASRVTLARKLESLREKLDATTLARLDAHSRARVEALSNVDIDGKEKDELSALATVHEGTAIAQLALLTLGQAQWKERDYEHAEQSFLHCARETSDGELAERALFKLASMYLDSEQSGLGLMAESLQRLAGEESLTGELSAPHDFDSVRDSDETIAKLRGNLTDERTVLGLASTYSLPGREPAKLELSGRAAWSYEPPSEVEPARILLFDRGLPRAIADRALVLGRDGYLECLSAEKKEILWRTKLQLPGSFETAPDAGLRSQTFARFGVADGQTIVVTGPDGIFAVGALTGRLLWGRAFDRAILDLAGSAARDRIMAASDGQVVAAPRDGYLTMMRLADGAPLWERDLRGETVARIWLEKGAVVFADADMKRVHLLNRKDGRLIARILLRQPDPEHERVTLVLTGGLLLGPDRSDNGEGVAAYDVSTGQQVWRTAVDKPVVSLFEPRPGYVGVGLLGGDVKIYKADSGEVALERSDPSVRAVTSGALWAGTLILRSNALRGPRQAIELAAFDIATGTEVWRRKDVAALGTSSERLEVAGGVIPAIIEKSKAESGGKAGGGTRVVAMASLIDVRTGVDAGNPAELSGAQQGIALNGDMVLWPGILAIGNMKGVQAIRVELTALPERGF